MSAATWQPPGLTIRLDHLDGADHIEVFDFAILYSFATAAKGQPAPEIKPHVANCAHWS